MRTYKMGKVPSGVDTIYIGRGSKYGNPFVMGADGTRAEVIDRYREYAKECLSKNPDWLLDLKGKDGLVCFCNPLPCHGDVLIELLKGE
jgi:hypothetical protein